MEQISFLAFDLGATSGRSILGTLRDGKLQMKELTRFPNQILELGGHYYWNIFSLYEHLKAGMIACAKEGAKITSIGIDTWGVDFALTVKTAKSWACPWHTEICIPRGLPRNILQRSCRARRSTTSPVFR